MIHKGKKMKTQFNKDFIRNFDYFGFAPKMFGNIEKYFNPNMQILDVGTGQGAGTRFLASKIKNTPNSTGKVYSIDLSDELQEIIVEILEEEKISKYVELIIADIEKNSFEDSFFDLIISLNSLHHFSNPINALNQMLRILKKEGTLCIIDWSKKARFLPHKKEDLFNLEDFKELAKSKKIIDEYSERLWWFVALKK